MKQTILFRPQMTATADAEFHALPEYPSRSSANNAPGPNGAIFSANETVTLRFFRRHAYNTGLCDCLASSYIGVSFPNQSVHPEINIPTGRTCIDAFFCLPCEIAFQTNKVKNDRSYMHRSTCGTLFALDALTSCGLALFMGGFQFVLLPNFCTSLYNGLHLRPYISLKYGIDESLWASNCQSICCTPCAVSQQKREMYIRRDVPGGICSARRTPSSSAHDDDDNRPGHFCGIAGLEMRLPVTAGYGAYGVDTPGTPPMPQ